MCRAPRRSQLAKPPLNGVRQFFSDPFAAMDFLVVLLDVVVLVASDAMGAAGGSTKALRTVRLVRLVRLAKIARLAKAGGRQCGALSEQRACRLRDCGCSHTTCSYSRHAVLGVSRIEVHHHNKESVGSKHVCACSQATQRCACECSGANGKRDKVAEAAFYAAKKKAAVVESNLL